MSDANPEREPEKGSEVGKTVMNRAPFGIWQAHAFVFALMVVCWAAAMIVHASGWSAMTGLATGGIVGLFALRWQRGRD